MYVCRYLCIHTYMHARACHAYRMCSLTVYMWQEAATLQNVFSCYAYRMYSLTVYMWQEEATLQNVFSCDTHRMCSLTIVHTWQEAATLAPRRLGDKPKEVCVLQNVFS